MRQFRVLFVYPNLYMVSMLPPAIGLMSALLRQRDIEVAVFDTTYYETDPSVAQSSAGPGERSSDKRKEMSLQVRPFDLGERGVHPRRSDMVADFLNLVDTFRPDLVALSAVEDTFHQGLFLLNQLGSRNIPTLVGGVFATFAPEIVIGQAAVRMVCVGEGERAIVELCERMRSGRDFGDVPNLWVKGPGGEIRRNRLGPLVDLDQLPVPDYSVFEENRIYRPMAGRVYRMIPVETHRGCPFGCAYCNSPAQTSLHANGGAGRFFRKKSVARIHEELASLVDRWKAEYVYFTADTLLAWSAAELAAFVDMYRAFRLPFWCQTRPETITVEVADMLEEAGCHRMSIGIEHGNEAFRRQLVGRRVTNEELIRKTNIVGARIPVSVNNITGFPNETRELAFDTIRLNRELQVDTMNCYNFVPYHGTPLRELAVKQGFLDPAATTFSPTARSILEMPGFPPSEIAGIVRTFSLYARLPESEWPRIRRAEIDDDEGNAIFGQLRDEYIERYFNDGKLTFG